MIKKSVQTKGTILTRLDAEMSDILKSTEMDEREKCMLYHQTLQKYLQYKKETPKKEEESSNNEKETEKKTTLDNLTNENIIETIPKKFQDKAKKLLDRLRLAGNVKWDNRGSLIIDNSHVRGNIIDLVNNAMRVRKGSPPTGQRQFAAALRRASIPHEFIGNRQVRNLVAASSSSDDDALQTAESSPINTPISTPHRKKSNEKTPNRSQWLRYR